VKIKKMIDYDDYDDEVNDDEVYEDSFFEGVSDLVKDFHSNGHYEIHVCTNGDMFDMADVASIFDTPEKLEEIGFGVRNRTVVALTPSGLEVLLHNGFSSVEIIREFDYEEDDY